MRFSPQQVGEHTWGRGTNQGDTGQVLTGRISRWFPKSLPPGMYDSTEYNERVKETLAMLHCISLHLRPEGDRLGEKEKTSLAGLEEEIGQSGL